MNVYDVYMRYLPTSYLLPNVRVFSRKIVELIVFLPTAVHRFFGWMDVLRS
jgi:hypothetical protein